MKVTMTALHQYSRLEAAGLWRSAPEAPRREVIVGLRDATIVLIDPKTEGPLAQWSLPAIVRVGAFEGFVIYGAHEDGEETLELDDPVMIAALDKVRTALDRRRKRPGRLRTALGAAAAAGLLAGIAIWLPLGMYDFTASRLPDAARRDIAVQAMADIATISGSPCAGAMGAAAAGDLARRTLPETRPAIAILREGLTAPASLPDGTILLPFAQVERAEGPDVLAGMVLAQSLVAKTDDPLVAALRYAGLLATMRLLSNGALPDGALTGYGLKLAQTNFSAPDSAGLQAAFASAGISSAPYAAFAADAALASLPDPAPQGSTPPVLEDAAFLALQYMCDQ
jgi:hypothetical protein